MRPNLQAIQILAARGDNLRAATPAQVRAVAIGLDQLLVPVLGKVSTQERRAWRIKFLNCLFGSAAIRYGGCITTAKNLSFPEAWSLIEWLHSDHAYGDLCVWVDEKGEVQ